MMIVESVWIDWLRDEHNPETDWLDEHLEWVDVALTDLILFEVLRGVNDVRVVGATERALLRSEVFQTGGKELALQAAGYCRLLRSKGVTSCSVADCLIATFCIREGHSLLHSDRDFDPFEKHLGLRVIHP